MGRSTTAEVKTTIELEFRCAKCGHDALASVFAEGEGSSSSMFANQAEAARDAAYEHALKLARISLAVAGCPTCGDADPKQGTYARSREILAKIWTGVVSTLIVAITFGFALSGGPWWAWVLSLVFAIGAVFATLDAGSKWGRAARLARERVKFRERPRPIPPEQATYFTMVAGVVSGPHGYERFQEGIARGWLDAKTMIARQSEGPWQSLATDAHFGAILRTRA